MLFHHVPSFVQVLFPGYIWHKNRDEKVVYLTFDDGPVPGVTDFVLGELSKRGMKATFFMVGDNVLKHPALALKVKEEGHRIGNHTHNHLNGALFPADDYLKNVEKCQSTLEQVLGVPTGLFRAPYGRMNRQQRKAVSLTHQIIMWDVLSGDYDERQSPERCLAKIKQHTRSGSIILFHDQKKTERIIFSVLPDFLHFIQSRGYRTELL